MQDTKLTDVVRAYCGPNDDAIDKATYFERCWPNRDPSHRQRIENIVVQGDKAFVTYRCSSASGKEFRNTEFLTFSGERIASVNVYFSAAYQDGVLV